jgi:hypothetical protein
MADNDRSFAPNTVSSNRAQMQGLGVGQQELNKQRVANPDLYATDPERTEPFDESLDPTTNADRPSQADFAGQDVGPAEPPRKAKAAGKKASGERARAPGAALDDRNRAGLASGAGDLGAGTPANVDVHDLGDQDKPQEAWGDEVEEEAIFSSNHSRRPIRTEAERGQGAKTRRLNKDIVSRRT